MCGAHITMYFECLERRKNGPFGTSNFEKNPPFSETDIHKWKRDDHRKTFISTSYLKYANVMWQLALHSYILICTLLCGDVPSYVCRRVFHVNATYSVALQYTFIIINIMKTVFQNACRFHEIFSTWLMFDLAAVGHFYIVWTMWIKESCGRMSSFNSHTPPISIGLLPVCVFFFGSFDVSPHFLPDSFNCFLFFRINWCNVHM